LNLFSSPKPKIKCGVAGVGSLGQHHARIYAALPNVEFVGIFEANDERAAEICTRHGCQRFASIEALGAACDAVSVVVPTDKHEHVAVPLLALGCHLLIEKPITATLEEAVPATGNRGEDGMFSVLVRPADPAAAGVPEPLTFPADPRPLKPAAEPPAAGR
jgi:NAD-dependent oxidoreductase involved in siderophore biosynthesis